MQTRLSAEFLNTPQGQQADEILRSCVHCGFCTATCPTYQLLGDELDSPRGRIYLIKQMLEGDMATEKTRTHLDRCLTCRACETTCPSGVQYGRLVDIGREVVEQQVPRSLLERSQRYLLRQIIPHPKRFALLLKLGLLTKPLLPAALQKKIPQPQAKAPWPAQPQTRRMLVLSGCAQQVVTAQTNIAAARILNRLGIELLQEHKVACCGAVNQHLSATEEARRVIRHNIDRWWPYIEQGIEAIVITASGCGVMVKDYAHLMADDADYADKAQKVSELARDISEVLASEDLSALPNAQSGQRIAFHSPCTLQHGLQLNGVVEKILQQAGFELTTVTDAHLCCGSAGTYSILQPALSGQLLHNKLDNLQRPQPELIATANIGCQMHLATQAEVPVIHWLELIDQATA
ncbi:MAG TPA: glycolate oxidase subunit GlcF [Gammaproteobacteria bacterium]